MSRFLDPPWLYAGLYWHDRPSEQSFDIVLGYCLRNGYRTGTAATVVRKQPGGLPADCMLDHSPHSHAEYRDQQGWSADAPRDDWLPVAVRLYPTIRTVVAAELEYGLASAAALAANQRRTIALMTSAAASSLASNPLVRTLDGDTRRRAAKADRWRDRFFARLVTELEPDYAGMLVEESLCNPTISCAAKDRG